MKYESVLKIFLVGILLISEVSCRILPISGNSGSPEWVYGESPRYPRDRYLVGVGYGESRRAAEDEAYAALSRIFQASIQSKTREWEEYLESSNKGSGSKIQSRLNHKIIIEQMTQVSTAKVLENVSIAEVWEDPRHRRIYALAVMDRVHAASMIQARIAELDRKAQSLFESATLAASSDGMKPPTNRLQAARDLHAAFKALLMREGLNADLKIIAPGGLGLEGPLSLTQVGQALRQALSQDFRVALKLSGPYPEEIRSAVLQGLTREGLIVMNPSGSSEAEGEGTEDVLVKGHLEMESLQLQGRPFYRWRVQFTLIDRSGNRIFGNMARNGREGHLRDEEAQARAVRAAQRVVREEVGPALAGIIFGEREGE